MSARDPRRFGGPAVALLRRDVDTDAIIAIDDCINRARPRFGEALFRRWRFEKDGRARADFVLNEPAARGARVLVAGPNFGCGSSREMAVWALADFGIRCVAAPDFGQIFYDNCFQNDVLAARLAEPDARQLGALVEERPGISLDVDLDALTIGADGLEPLPFALDALRREMLLEGLDPVAATLTREPAIAAFEARDRAARPWLDRAGAGDADRAS